MLDNERDTFYYGPNITDCANNKIFKSLNAKLFYSDKIFCNKDFTSYIHFYFRDFLNLEDTLYENISPLKDFSAFDTYV